MNKSLIKKIETLNEANNYIVYGLKLINKLTKKDKGGDVSTLIWKIEKQLNLLQKQILKKLKTDTTNDEFKSIIEGFKQ